jgi:hypothetical protein
MLLTPHLSAKETVSPPHQQPKFKTFFPQSNFFNEQPGKKGQKVLFDRANNDFQPSQRGFGLFSPHLH